MSAKAIWPAADKAFNAVAEQAHAKDFANLEAEAYRSMSLYQLEGAASLALLAKAEAALHEAHKVPQSLLNQELATVLRTRVERVPWQITTPNWPPPRSSNCKRWPTPMTLTALSPARSMALPEPWRSPPASLPRP